MAKRFMLPIALLCGLSTSVAAQNVGPTTTLPANRTPSQTIPQTSAAVARIEAALGTITLPRGFKIALFALLPDARAMAVSADGRKVFVGTPDASVFVIDLETPSGPVASVKTFAPSIPMTMPHGVCFGRDGTLYVAEQNRILAFAEAAGAAENPDLVATVVVAQGALIPPAEQSPYHSLRVCRVGPDGKLYVTVGQPHNVPTADKWALYAKVGMGAIVRMSTDGSHREIYATGIRNSVGLDFNPKDRTLWFTDNQVDHMGDDIPPGELNRATEAGQNFGFPWYGGGHTRTNEYKSIEPPPNLVFPQVEMIAHAADLGMTFYRGTRFPVAYRGGIFSVQHGSWNRTVPVGARVMFTSLKPDGTADKSAPFAEGWLATDGTYHGRPADVAELPDGSLLVSDDFNGAIYRISFEGSDDGTDQARARNP